MPMFRIVVEDTTTILLVKAIDAPTLEDAKAQAEAESWDRENGWEHFDGYSNAEVREDLSIPMNRRVS